MEGKVFFPAWKVINSDNFSVVSKAKTEQIVLQRSNEWKEKLKKRGYLFHTADQTTFLKVSLEIGDDTFSMEGPFKHRMWRN